MRLVKTLVRSLLIVVCTQSYILRACLPHQHESSLCNTNTKLDTTPYNMIYRTVRSGLLQMDEKMCSLILSCKRQDIQPKYRLSHQNAIRFASIFCWVVSTTGINMEGHGIIAPSFQVEYFLKSVKN